MLCRVALRPTARASMSSSDFALRMAANSLPSSSRYTGRKRGNARFVALPVSARQGRFRPPLPPRPYGADKCFHLRDIGIAVEDEPALRPGRTELVLGSGMLFRFMFLHPDLKIRFRPHFSCCFQEDMESQVHPADPITRNSSQKWEPEYLHGRALCIFALEQEPQASHTVQNGRNPSRSSLGRSMYR